MEFILISSLKEFANFIYELAILFLLCPYMLNLRILSSVSFDVKLEFELDLDLVMLELMLVFPFDSWESEFEDEFVCLKTVLLVYDLLKLFLPCSSKY